MSVNPITILNAAIREVPAMKYALAVAGLAATAALVGLLVEPSRTTLIVVAAIIVGMVLILTFSVLATKRDAIAPAGYVLLYTVTFFFCSFLFLVVTAFVANWPPRMITFLGLDTPEPTSNIWRMHDIKTAELRVTQIDDFADIFVNDQVVIENARYGEVIPWRSFRQFLKPGPNELRILVRNGKFGGCGAKLEVKINGAPIPSLEDAWSIPRTQAGVDGVCVEVSKTLTVK